MNVVAGRGALVTGAGNGLGAAIARALHAAGARVVLVGRDEAKLRATAAGLPGSVVAPCDVADATAVAGLAERLVNERVDIVVNNAGVGGPVAPLVEIDPDAWDAVFAANVRSIFLMCRAFLPPMVAAGGGDVINIASVTGKRPLINRTPYAASKMAVIGLTRTLAFEVAQAGVRVNSLSPGPVEGERMKRNFDLAGEREGTSAQQAREAFVSRAAAGRMVTEDEVADAVLAMLSMTGLVGADVDLSAGMIA